MAWYKYFDLRIEFEIQRKHCFSTCMRIKLRQVHAELLFYKRQFIAGLARQITISPVCLIITLK